MKQIDYYIIFYYRIIYLQKMCDSVQKSSELLQITKNTEDNSIIEERLGHKGSAEGVRKYMKGKLLGKGGFARCYEATNIQTKKIYAIKIVCKQNLKKSKAKQKLITEIKIHKMLKHKRIVTFDHVFEDNQNVYILLQLCSNYTLNELLKKRKRLSELEVQYFLLQIVQGLKYIHGTKVIHRDLKLGNLMLSQNMELKIGDFGLAARLQSHHERKKTICGTPNYIAPQILQGKGHSYQVDIWSLGALIYALLVGRPPFETNDVKKTYKRIKQCEYSFPSQTQISQNAKNLISKMLVVDPSKRITLQQIKSHPFLQQNKIPQSLPNSILTVPPSQNFFDNYRTSSNNSKAFIRNESASKLQMNANISDRLLLRSSSSVNRNNYFTKLGVQKNPRLTANNFFKSPSQSHLESNKKAREIMMQEKGDTTFVRKWVDYSSKYGLGYLLSDRSTGIYFNDASKIVLSYTCNHVDYISSSGQLTTYTLDNLPNQRQFSKKITLMEYFRKYLNNGSSISEGQNRKKGPPFCYVKRWVKNQYGILFRLSNKVIQVNFIDKSQLVLYCDKNIGVFSNSNHNVDKIFFELGSHETAHPMLAKKIEEMSKMLKQMKNPRENKTGIAKQDVCDIVGFEEGV